MHWAWQIIIATLLYISVASLSSRRDAKGRKYVFPKGPRGIPIFGNQFQLPPFGVGPLAKRWAEKYGELMHLRLAGTDLIYLNSSRVVSEILEKRSSLTSSRPYQPMAGEIVSGGSRILMMPYNARWRTSRRLAHQVLMSSNVQQYESIMEKETCQLLWEYHTQPKEWYLSNNRIAHSLLMNMVFGERRGKPDALMNEIFQVSEDFILELQPGKNLVDSFPSMARLPKWLQWWRKRGEELYKKTCETFEPIQDNMLRKISTGGVDHCFGKMMMEKKDELGLNDHQAMFIGGSLVETGSDTLRASLNAIIAGAVAQPDWTDRARQELDRVCGNAERLPYFSDIKNLPFVQAAVKESLRWKPLVEAGVNHMATEDFEFEEYYFPKGTLFTWNAWAICQNPVEYKDPDCFLPERFLDEEVGNPLHGLWAFGAGRRTCPGHSVAAKTLFITLARLLYCFTFEYEGGKFDRRSNVFFQASSPAFPMKITARSEAHVQLIEREWSRTRAELEKLDRDDTVQMF